MKIHFRPVRVMSAAFVVLVFSGCVSYPPLSDQTAPHQVSASEKAQAVKGINGWEGTITGTPAAKSVFTPLQIGMSMKQATDLAGTPTDQGAYMTGKAWIPFYFGSDRHRYEVVYKNQGRLIFAGGSLGNFTGGNLIMIIHNDKEVGYR